MVKRRDILGGIGAVGIVSITGCLGDDDPSSPTQVIEHRFEALDSGDNERVRELTHSDRPDPLSQEDLAEWESADVEVNDIELIEESDDVATVEVVYVIETALGPNARTEEIELRKEDGEWRMYSSEIIESE